MNPGSCIISVSQRALCRHTSDGLTRPSISRAMEAANQAHDLEAYQRLLRRAVEWTCRKGNLFRPWRRILVIESIRSLHRRILLWNGGRVGTVGLRFTRQKCLRNTLYIVSVLCRIVKEWTNIWPHCDLSVAATWNHVNCGWERASGATPRSEP